MAPTREARRGRNDLPFPGADIPTRGSDTCEAAEKRAQDSGVATDQL